MVICCAASGLAKVFTVLDYDYITSSDRGDGVSPLSISPQQKYLVFLLLNNLFASREISFINKPSSDELEEFLTELLDLFMTIEDTDDMWSIGDLRMIAHDSEPTNWMICDGRLLEESEYPALFALIGQQYGYSGSTFAIPDFRQRSPMGDGAILGNTELNGIFPIGFQTNDYKHLLSIEELPAHSHSKADANAGSSGIFHSAASPYNGNGTPAAGWLTGETGGGLAHNNIHPVSVCRFIIKVL